MVVLLLVVVVYTNIIQIKNMGQILAWEQFKLCRHVNPCQMSANLLIN
jgi:hypothetical protein